MIVHYGLRATLRTVLSRQYYCVLNVCSDQTLSVCRDQILMDIDLYRIEVYFGCIVLRGGAIQENQFVGWGSCDGILSPPPVVHSAITIR